MVAVAEEQDPDAPVMISIKEAARILGVSYWTCFRLLENGRLPSIRLGKATANNPLGRTIRVRRDLVIHFAMHGELPDNLAELLAEVSA